MNPQQLLPWPFAAQEGHTFVLSDAQAGCVERLSSDGICAAKNSPRRCPPTQLSQAASMPERVPTYAQTTNATARMTKALFPC